MLDSEKHQIYVMASAKWGKQAQALKFIEEACELNRELIRKDLGEDNLNKIIEEIADVSIMLEQLILTHECERRVAEKKKEKLLRLKERLKN